jgi:hypothetical protein
VQSIRAHWPASAKVRPGPLLIHSVAQLGLGDLGGGRLLLELLPNLATPKGCIRLRDQEAKSSRGDWTLTWQRSACA